VASWAETGITLAAELLAGDVDPRRGAPGLLRRALASLPRGVRRVALRADAGYFAVDLAVAAHREGVRFAIGAKRIAPLWRTLAGIAESDWAQAIEMPGAQLAVADYRPAWWPSNTRLLIRRVHLGLCQVSADSRARRRRTLHPDQRSDHCSPRRRARQWCHQPRGEGHNMRLRQGVADALIGEGVDVVFALIGDGNQELMVDLGERCGVAIVKGRHEQGVVGMADGYARFSGRPGVATVTQGPGLTNTATSLVAAARRRVPVLVLAGDVSLGDVHNPQGFDQQAFAELMTGHGARVESERGLTDIFAAAFHEVRSGHPFVLSLPADVQNIDLGEGWGYQPYSQPPQGSSADPDLVELASQIVGGARQAAVLAGRGAVDSDAGRVLGELGEALGAPLMTTLLANGLFSGHRLNAGVCGGFGDGRALRALEHCDVVVAVGAELNQWTTHFGQALDGRRLVQVDIDTAAFGRYYRPDVALLGDATATVRALTDRIRAQQESSREPSAELKSILEREGPLDSSPYLDTESSVDPRHALADIDRLLPPDRKVVIDGGHAAMVACQSLRASRPRDWTCTSYGDFSAIGQGLSVAIGACFAHPGERITHVTADGALMMGLAEFDTAVRYSLPLTVVVLNDHSMGEERHNLAHKGMPTKYADYPSRTSWPWPAPMEPAAIASTTPISSTSSQPLSTTTLAWSSSTFVSTVTTSTPSSATSPNTSRASPRRLATRGKIEPCQLSQTRLS
jgi:acetolactate synthase I/II/III large subunit